MKWKVVLVLFAKLLSSNLLLLLFVYETVSYDLSNMQQFPVDVF